MIEERNMTTLKIIWFLMLISASNQQNQNEEQCGQYGFRCVDVESFQICTYPDLDGLTDAPEAIHKCFDHNVCDENNPAYCTPVERPEYVIESKEKTNQKCQKKFSRNINALEDINKWEQGLKDDKFNNNLNIRDTFDFNNEEDETEPTTTTESEDDYTFTYQKFECENFGYFPGMEYFHQK